MATVAAPLRRPVKADRIFFPSMCILILVTVWLGFSKTYYAAGMVRAKLPSPIIHVHAVLFTLWLLTLIVQTGLINAKRLQLHRKLGLWGFGLTVLMVVIGFIAGTDSLRRNFSPPGSGLDPKIFYAVPIVGILTFGVLIGWAYRSRNKPLEHKRLIIFATLILLQAAVGRFPYTIAPMGPLTRNLIFIGLATPMIAYDLLLLKKVHRITVLCTLSMVVVGFGSVPLGMTPMWQKFAAFMRG